MITSQVQVLGDSVVIQDEKLKEFDGQQITVSIVLPSKQKKDIDFDSYPLHSERANIADEYIKEFRSNDRF